MNQSTKTEENKPSIWVRLKKLSLTITIVVCLLFSFANTMTLEKFKASIGPIGTNPAQYSPTKFYTAELGTEHLHPRVNFLTDTIVGHNYSTNMLTRLGTVNDIRSGLATTASLSDYVTNSGLTTTLGGYVTSSGLTGSLSNYVTNSSLSTTLASYTTNSSLSSTLSGYTTSSALTSALSSYATTASLSGYVPNTRMLTINGTAFDLSANRSWTIPGTTYSAGTGLSLTGTTFANTAPDQTVNLTAGAGLSVTGTYPNYVVSLAARTINNNPGRTIITNAAAANGFQISSTKEADITYSPTINTSVSLSGNSAGYVVLEICATNSATAGDWIEVSRVSSGQSGTLVVGLVLNQIGGAPVFVDKLPAGWYARIRSVNTSGTPTYSISGQREVY